MGKINLDVIIAYEIKYKIESEFQVGEKLPSERQLAEEFGVSRITIRSALKMLLYEGNIISKQRQGYFVAPKRIIKNLYKFEATSTALIEAGYKLDTITLRFEDSVVDKTLIRPFEESIGTPIYKIERLRKADGKPIMLDYTYLLKKYIPRLNESDLEDNTLYKVLYDNYGISMLRSEKTISIIPADEYVSRYLEVDIGEPLADQSGLVFDNKNRKIEYSRSLMLVNTFAYTG